MSWPGFQGNKVPRGRWRWVPQGHTFPSETHSDTALDIKAASVLNLALMVLPGVIHSD